MAVSAGRCCWTGRRLGGRRSASNRQSCLDHWPRSLSALRSRYSQRVGSGNCRSRGRRHRRASGSRPADCRASRRPRWRCSGARYLPGVGRAAGSRVDGLRDSRRVEESRPPPTYGVDAVQRTGWPYRLCRIAQVGADLRRRRTARSVIVKERGPGRQAVIPCPRKRRGRTPSARPRWRRPSLAAAVRAQTDFLERLIWEHYEPARRSAVARRFAATLLPELTGSHILDRPTVVGDGLGPVEVTEHDRFGTMRSARCTRGPVRRRAGSC